MARQGLSGTARVVSDGVEVRLRVPTNNRAEWMADNATARGKERATVSHSPEFASVNWHGKVYTFSGKQRSVVAALFQAREQGYHWLTQEALLDIAESDCGRLRDLFRGHPAWGTMIVQALTHCPEGGPPGSYGLAPDVVAE